MAPQSWQQGEGDAFVVRSTMLSHASGGREDGGDKAGMLHLPQALLIRTTLSLFMTDIGSSK